MTTTTWWSWYVWISEPNRPGFMLDLLGFSSKFEAREWVRRCLDKYARDHYVVDGGMETGYRIRDLVLKKAREIHNGPTLPDVESGCPIAISCGVSERMVAPIPAHPAELDDDAPVMDDRIPLATPKFRGQRLVVLMPLGQIGGCDA